MSATSAAAKAVPNGIGLSTMENAYTTEKVTEKDKSTNPYEAVSSL